MHCQTFVTARHLISLNFNHLSPDLKMSFRKKMIWCGWFPKHVEQLISAVSSYGNDQGAGRSNSFPNILSLAISIIWGGSHKKLIEFSRWTRLTWFDQFLKPEVDPLIKIWSTWCRSCFGSFLLKEVEDRLFLNEGGDFQFSILEGLLLK